MCLKKELILKIDKEGPGCRWAWGGGNLRIWKVKRIMFADLFIIVSNSILVFLNDSSLHTMY